MTPLAETSDLLRRFAAGGDQAAFAAIVQQHVNLVYSAAVRRVGQREMAQDVTQAVFVILARKAKSIRDGKSLSAWLLKTVRYAAANALRIEARRRAHEQEAARRAASGGCSANPTDVLVWQEMAQHLDDAVLKLPAIDRRAVLLRYFEDRAIAEIATELNVSEGAAKQRLSRAVEKLRQRLAGRAGLVGATDATALATILASQVLTTTPPGLSGAALAAASGGATAAAGISIAKGAMTMMCWAKLKAAAVVMIGVTVIGGAGGVVALKNASAQAKEAAAAPAAEEKPAKSTISVEKAPPVVVKTIPMAGAKTIDPATSEIRVTYSKDMADGSWSWSTLGEENFPKTTGKPKYMEDKRTCVLPVKLEPGRGYAIWLNSNNFGNFKDTAGNQAVPYLLVFETRPAR